ncbi:hypothetical protein [uncultured Acetobacteroides sp.]|uniref:hypothetical protein n=1 Tax=uncultured Acetobacteroides sp. TaxID=1760811 RepID=UPI0029F54659|nr:hypothetical protein [uncultured Acetobacteroides sp.]
MIIKLIIKLMPWGINLHLERKVLYHKENDHSHYQFNLYEVNRQEMDGFYKS